MASELLQKEVGGPIGYEFFMPPNRHLRFHLFNSPNHAVIESASALNDDSWHHVAGVRDHVAHTIRLYVDGVLQGTSTENVGDISNATDLLLAHGNSLPYTGKLDEIRFSDQALQPGEFLFFSSLPALSIWASVALLAILVSAAVVTLPKREAA